MAEILTPGSLSGMNQTPTSPVLASVNGKPITAEDVDRFIAAMGRNGQAYNNPQGRAAVLEKLSSNMPCSEPAAAVPKNTRMTLNFREILSRSSS